MKVPCSNSDPQLRFIAMQLRFIGLIYNISDEYYRTPSFAMAITRGYSRYRRRIINQEERSNPESRENFRANFILTLKMPAE